MSGICSLGTRDKKLTLEATYLSVASRVRFLSRVPSEQMPDIYRLNDIFVMSSAHEGMSNAMLEAMACGLPIVSSSCEGTEELIADNGVIVPQANPELFAQAIKKLADSPEVYLAMSRKASEHAKKFSWHDTAGQYYNLYGSIAKAAKER
ncbi:MAG: glycosyltransferase [Candidatus Brocadiia bacterium]|nr:MAG: glycosyltransferase [Candidatus Brocadiia bacterium]